MTAARFVLRSEYRDSGTLMRLARDLGGRAGVLRTAALMATPRNLEQLAAMGLLPETPAARPSDLLVVVEAGTEAEADAALTAVDGLLSGPARRTAPRAGGGARVPRSLEAALELQPASSLAVISVPGPYAAREARRALGRGLHVFLFSNGVALEDEVALKEEASRKGLLVMGPDCGTSIVDGVPIGFANRVRRGPIGLVGASGTGLQEVSTLVHRLGCGVSHALGTGGRDLSDAVGAATTRAALALLARDPATRVVVLVSKPPSPVVAARVLAEAGAIAAAGRRVVACFLGLDAERAGELPAGVTLAPTLDDAARRACEAAGHTIRPVDVADAPDAVGPDSGPPRRLLGLFSGGTLAHEALLILRASGVSPRSNLHVDGVQPPDGQGHTILDLGEDEYTRGRPHPMIDPTLRQEAIRRAGTDPGSAVLLLDVVLGYGSHPDPAAALEGPIREARRDVLARGGFLPVIASVTGTELDPQDRERQVARLRGAGVHVAESNAAAARMAARFIPAGGGDR